MNLLWLLLLLLVGCATPDVKPPAAAASPAPPAQASASASPAAVAQANTKIGFRSRQKWQDHFQKHGKEFGDISADEYLRLAQELRDRKAPVMGPGIVTEEGDILTAARSDGTFSRYDRSSGSFLACNRDGTIRTFFKPRDGERYFRKQINKPHD